MANSGGDIQQNILVNIGVTGQDEVNQAKQGVQQLTNATQQSGKVDMAAPVKSLRQELRNALNETQRLAAAGQTGTAAYRESAQRVAELRNTIEDTNRSIKNFDAENRFRVAATAAGQLTKAAQGYTATLQLIGLDSEDTTKQIAKLQQVMAFADAIDSLKDLGDTWKDLKGLLGLTTIASKANSTATAANTVATQAETVAVTENTVAETANIAAVEANATAQGVNATATEAATVATEGASVASKTLSLSLKGLGIGLIIAALVLLVENWEKVKKTIDKLIPGLGGVDNLFKNLKSTAVGLGVAVLDVFKGIALAITDLFSLNFSGALDDLKKGFQVQKNFTDAFMQNAKEQAEEARIERVKKEIEANTRIIAERKALGEDTYKLEVANQRLKNSVLDKDDKDYKKNKADGESALTILINTERKKQSDKYKELLKTDLDNIKANNEAAKKIVAEGSASERDLALKDLQIKYDAEFKLLEKRRKDIEDGRSKDLKGIENYNKDFNTLTEARKIEEERLNKKYDDAIKTYNDEVDSAYLSTYEKKANDINKKANDLLKTANPQQKAQIEQDRTFQLNQNTDESNADTANTQAKTALTVAEDENRPKDTDTPDEARKKIENLAKAKFDAENAAFELKKVQLVGQQDEIASITADHNKALTDNEEANAKARKDITTKEKEARLATLDQIGQGLQAASDLAGENTVAGKALAVASTTVSTYLAAQQAYASQLIPGDPTSPIRAAIAAGVAVVSGLANVKKILSVQVPGATAGGTGGAALAPPIINSTVIQRNNNGSDDIRDSLNKSAEVQQQQAQTPIRAYIVDKDLEKQKDKASYYNSQSTF